MFNIDTSKSYSTEANLLAALGRLNLSQFHPLVVCNRTGRFTAIFAVSRLEGDIACAARRGFMTIG